MTTTKALIVAANSGDYDSLQNLLPTCFPSDLNGVDDDGSHPLFHAVKSGLPELVVALLNQNYIQIDLDTPQGTALHWVCRELSDHTTLQSANQSEDCPTARLSTIMMVLLFSGATAHKPNQTGFIPRQIAKAQAAQVF